MRSNSELGLTLVECTIALVIVGTAVVVGLQALASQTIVAAEEKSTWEALLHLSNAAERLRTVDYEGVASSPFTAVAEQPEYEIQTTVVAVSAVCRQATLTVRWQSLSGRYQRRSLVTFRCEGVD